MEVGKNCFVLFCFLIREGSKALRRFIGHQVSDKSQEEVPERL